MSSLGGCFIAPSATKARLFILDDATPFGIRTDRILGFFERDPSISILRSDRLAAELAKRIPEEDTVVPVAYGGIMVFALLRRAGLLQSLDGYLITKRVYDWSERERRVMPVMAECSAVGIDQASSKTNILDDIVASGMTVDTCIRKFYGRVDSVSTLVVSGVVSKGDRYRVRAGSTIPGADNLYSAISVTGTSGRPSIYSLRYLLEKAKYAESELARFVQRYMPNDRGEFKQLMLEAEEARPFKLLRKSPCEFLETYSKKT